jgi:hypothetical protein
MPARELLLDFPEHIESMEIAIRNPFFFMRAGVSRTLVRMLKTAPGVPFESTATA